MEVPQIQYVDRLVAVLVVMQRQSSMIVDVAGTAEIPQMPFTDRIVDDLVMVQSQAPTKKHSSTQVPYVLAWCETASRDWFNKGMVSIPVDQQRRVPTVQAMKRTVEYTK